MKITELKLFTNQLEKQKEFFLKVLGFEFLDETENEFCLKIGWSKLRFVKSKIFADINSHIFLP